jgi:putative membrane protein
VARLAESLATWLADGAIHTACRRAVRRIDLSVEGLEHLPASGPAVIAARHFHHVYDGCVLVAVAPRPLKILVTLDWLHNAAGRQCMRAACRLARWPVVVRTGAQTRHDGPTAARRQLLAATREGVELLLAGQLLLVFPEGYPNVDPSYTPKTGDDVFLPFRPGFLRIAALAERDGVTRVPIVPVGLEYRRGDRGRVAVRFGQPVRLVPGRDVRDQVAAIEEQVRRLSGPMPANAAVEMGRNPTAGVDLG